MAGFGYIPRRGRMKDAVCRIAGHPNLLRRLQAPLLLALLDPGPSRTVLDVGCGSGWLTRELARRSRFAAGIDLAVDPSSRRGLPPNCALLEGDGTALPFRSGSFDRVLLSSVLQMVPDDRGLLAEARRVLAPGGRAVLSVPVGYLFLDRLYRKPGAFLRLLARACGFPETAAALRERLGAGFGVRGRGYYGPGELRVLLRDSGFSVAASRFAPGRVASAAFEAWLLIAVALRLNPSSTLPFAFFPLLRPLAGARGAAGGDEIVMEVRPA